ncbi:MAG: DUF2892 domain-containing protein [Anaerolineales bacterium]|nr:DUF2892 domain-containing protein [Anaerolineales bacterium]
MKCNVGSIDRVIRVLLGLVIIALGFYFNSWFGAIGIIPLFTAAVGWCPLYMPFGLSTCSTKS